MLNILFLLFALSLNNADCLIENDSTVITQTRKGNIETYRFLKIKILNERGRDYCGDIKIRYDKQSSEFKILKAYTLLPDGKKVKVEKDAVMDVGAPETAMAPDYTTRVIKAVSFPALRNGAEIVYEYVIKSKKTGKEPLFGTVLFRSKNPILKKVFILDIPLEKKLQYKKVNDGNITVKIDTGNSNIRYIFTAENVEKLPDEDFIPPINEIVPRIDYTELKNTEEMAKWLYSKFEDKATPDKKIKELAKSLMEDDEVKTFYNIVKYVQEEIENINLYLWDAGFVPHSASWVLKHKYGDVRDKTVLALALLEACGIKAEPVLVETKRGEYSASVKLTSVLSENNKYELPVPSHYTTMIIKAYVKDTVLYASPMDRFSDIRSLPSQLQAKRAFSFWKGKGKYSTTPLLPQSDNSLHITLKGSVKEDGSFNGVWRFLGNGFYSGKIRRIFRYKKPDEIKIMLDNLAKAFGQTAKIDSYILRNIETRENPPEVCFYVSSRDFANTGKILEFTIPLVSIITRFATCKERKLPLLTGIPRIIEYTAKINVPDKSSPFLLPENINLSGELNSLKSSMELSNNTVNYRAVYTINSQKVSKEHYKDFRRIEGLFFSKNNRHIILSLQ